VLFVLFVDRFYAAEKMIHESHEFHENVLNSTFEAKPK
jgi:hypothetical protein